MIGKLHRSGASFRGAVAYCLDEARDRDREADGPDEPTTDDRSRVAWTETVNLATDDARIAARQMAATVSYATELKGARRRPCRRPSAGETRRALLVVLGAG